MHYISPEQVSASGADPRSDIYSVGVMMYEMLTGVLPFDAENPVSVALMQLQTPPEPPTKHCPEIPEGLEEIILKCMAKNPDNRYETAQDLMDDIERFKLNPSIKFEYKYLSDENPTKYIDAIKTIKSGEEFESDERRRSYLGTLSGIMVAVVLIVVAFVLLVAKPWASSVPTDVKIPSLVGLVYDDVVADTETYKDFRIVELQRVYNDDYEAGQIFSQSPVEGMVVKPGADIKVSVSLGPKKSTVPSVIGKNYIQAQIDITKLGLKCDTMREYSESVVEDYVIRTDPEAGTELEAGSTVLLYVSEGRKINKVSVPTLVGLTEDEARRQLNEIGLVAAATLVPGDKAYGTVLTQNIQPDQQVDEGTIINLEISDGSSAPIQKEITVTFPKSPATFTLTIKKSGETVYEATHLADEKSVRLVLSGRGTEIVEIYINNILKESGFVDFS